MALPRLSILSPGRKSLPRGVLLSLVALAAGMILAGFPRVDALHPTDWQALPALVACLAIADTAGCLRRRWSFYHAGVLIFLYTELMILMFVLFLWFYP